MDIWEKEEDLENAKEVVEEFGTCYRDNQRVISQKEEFEEGFKWEMPERFTVKTLFGWDDAQFDREYLT